MTSRYSNRSDMLRGWLGRSLQALCLTIGLGFIVGCASTTGGGAAQGPVIPEGKGHLILEAGGIRQMNFTVINQETEEEVYNFDMRPSAYSPSFYERGNEAFELQAFLDPGLYTVFANTDFDQTIEIPDVQINVGEETHKTVQVGRFMLNVTNSGTPVQVPFVLYDYNNMSNLLGKGMTSTQVRHFIAQTGIYKIRIEQLEAGIDAIRDVTVAMGRVIPIRIELSPATEQGPEQGAGEGEGQP